MNQRWAVMEVTPLQDVVTLSLRIQECIQLFIVSEKKSIYRRHTSTSAAQLMNNYLKERLILCLHCTAENISGQIFHTSPCIAENN